MSSYEDPYERRARRKPRRERLTAARALRSQRPARAFGTSVCTAALAALLVGAIGCQRQRYRPVERGTLVVIATGGDELAPELRGSISVRSLTNELVFFVFTGHEIKSRSQYELPPGLYSVSVNADCEAEWPVPVPRGLRAARAICPPPSESHLIQVVLGRSSLVHLSLAPSPEAACAECTGTASQKAVVRAGYITGSSIPRAEQ